MIGDQSATATAAPEPTATRNPRRLRIGDRVRSVVDDVNQTVGLEGLVVNISPTLFLQRLRARILWDNETASMADDSTFVMLPTREAS